jgi:hypothetical protein
MRTTIPVLWKLPYGVIKLIQFLKVGILNKKCFSKWVLWTISLNTIRKTIFQKSDKTIMRSKNTLVELVTKSVHFPPTSIGNCEEKLSYNYHPRCKQCVSNDCKKLFKCTRCGFAWAKIDKAFDTEIVISGKWKFNNDAHEP